MTRDEPIFLDLKGLNCPLPALRTRKALKAMPAGATLLVECTDPLSAIDIPHCVFEAGDTLESQSADGGVLRFRIRRTAKKKGGERLASRLRLPRRTSRTAS